ncbi:hypothetical protein F4804DRAFT_151555 [Jackrogersella minutella]|nr:hypothetical protein F4804DRAFT_151555 [Jackrogersella minutella]
MSSQAKDIDVSVSTPMPHRYIFVPKGNPYKTLNCRKKTHAEGQPVYVVYNNKHRQLGIRVPLTIFEAVQEKYEETRESRAEATKKRDGKTESEFHLHVLSQFPHIPESEIPAIVKQATKKHSGRVGRTGKLDIASKVQLAVRAHIRHNHTDYDSLLDSKVPREAARDQVAGQVNATASKWGYTPKAKTPSRKSPSLASDVSKQTKASNSRHARKPKSPSLKDKKRSKRRQSAASSIASQNKAMAAIVAGLC